MFTNKNCAVRKSKNIISDNKRSRCCSRRPINSVYTSIMETLRIASTRVADFCEYSRNLWRGIFQSAQHNPRQGFEYIKSRTLGACATFAMPPPHSADNNRVSRISLIANEGRRETSLFAVPPRAG